MKRIIMVLLFVVSSIFGYSQDEPKPTPGFTGGIKFGNVSFIESGVNVNYFMLGLKGDFPIGKFGFGLDVNLLINQDGDIREEDWDEWGDYLDKIYYIRYGEKGFDPFYIKLGGLDYSYIGYSNIFNGYTNMLQYPQIKKYGLESEIDLSHVKVEFLMGDIKEVIDKGSSVIGGRVGWNIIGDLQLGASFGADLNQYGILFDDDGDGVVNELDRYPQNEDYSTQYEKDFAAFKNILNLDGTRKYTDEKIKENLEGQIDIGNLSPQVSSDIVDYTKETKALYILGLDLGYPIVNTESVDISVYTHGTKIIDYGWGAAIPGIRFSYNGFLNIFAEYRIQSKEFMFGYFNNTYEIERSKFAIHKNSPKDSVYVAVTGDQRLKSIIDPMQGFIAGFDINILGTIVLKSTFQKMFSDSKDISSLTASLGIAENIIPNIQKAEAYYVQNNVDDISVWRTPSTLIGARFIYNLSGVALGINYKLTFKDINGDGDVEDDAEAIKTFEVTAGITF